MADGVNIKKKKNEALRLLGKGKIDKAIQIYEDIIKEKIDSKTKAEILNNLGDLYIRKQDIAKAVEVYEESFKLYKDEEFVDNAIAVGKKILRYEKNKKYLYLELADLYSETGNQDSSLEALEHVITEGMDASYIERAFVIINKIAEKVQEDEQHMSRFERLFMKLQELSESFGELSLESGTNIEGADFGFPAESQGPGEEEVVEEASEPVSEGLGDLEEPAGQEELIKAKPPSLDFTGAEGPKEPQEEGALELNNVEEPPLPEDISPPPPEEEVIELFPSEGTESQGKEPSESVPQPITEKHPEEPAEFATAQPGQAKEAEDFATAQPEISGENEQVQEEKVDTGSEYRQFVSSGKYDDFYNAPEDEIEDIDETVIEEQPQEQEVVKGPAGVESHKTTEENIEKLSEIFNKIMEDLFTINLKDVYGEEDPYEIGMTLYDMELYDFAIDYLQKSMRNAVYRLKSIEMIGRIFIELEEYEFAVKILEKVLEEGGYEEYEYAGINYYLGRAFEAMGNDEKAFLHFEYVYLVDRNYKDIKHRIEMLKMKQLKNY